MVPNRLYTYAVVLPPRQEWRQQYWAKEADWGRASGSGAIWKQFEWIQSGVQADQNYYQWALDLYEVSPGSLALFEWASIAWILTTLFSLVYVVQFGCNLAKKNVQTVFKFFVTTEQTVHDVDYCSRRTSLWYFRLSPPCEKNIPHSILHLGKTKTKNECVLKR